jgi:hypothetical protein
MKEKKTGKQKKPPPMPGVKCRNQECGESVPAHARNCMVCGEDAGFPNVRAADDAQERAALSARVQDARAQAEQKGTLACLERFRAAVNQSSAVICRSIAMVYQLVQADTELHNTFYQQVEAWGRVPEDNEWDKGRESVDALVFPHYHKDIRFAALSLNDQGMSGYGALTVVLKDVAIRNRATVFEQNTMTFCKERGVVAGGTVPRGYRAVWAERGDLAAAKLHERLSATTTDEEFPGVLLPVSGARDGDCIEAHVYGPLHRRAIAKVTGKEPKNTPDKVLMKSVRAKLLAIDVPVESVS